MSRGCDVTSMGHPPYTRGSVTFRTRIGAVSITEARHPPGRTLPLHAHPVACVTLVVGGGFSEQLDGRHCPCRPGDVLFRPADAAHANRFGPDGAEYLVVEIPNRVLSAFDDRRDHFSDIRIFRRAGAGNLATREIRQAGHRPDGDGLEVEELLLELLGALSEGAPAGDRAPDGDPPPAWLRRVYDRVHAEFRNRPPIAELAAEAGVHPDHVCRSFRRHFGFTISDLVRRRRVETAARVIRASDRPLSAVAYGAGFSDQSHMTRQMKRHLGVTPAGLRR